MTTHQKKHNKTFQSKELLLCNSDIGEDYGIITSVKGDLRFEVKIIKNNTLITAKACGRLTKGPRKQKLSVNDYVLLQKNIELNNIKYYILYKYNNNEIKELKKLKEIVNIKYVNDDDDVSPLDRTITNTTYMSNISFDDEINNDINYKYDDIITDDFIANI